MNENAIIQAIGELDGINIKTILEEEHQYKMSLVLNPSAIKFGRQSTIIPDYLNSRDAIIPVIEKVINTLELMSRFRDSLMLVCGLNPYYWEWQTANEFFILIVKATPSQLAEALLKTTNKWQDISNSI